MAWWHCACAYMASSLRKNKLNYLLFYSVRTFRSVVMNNWIHWAPHTPPMQIHLTTTRDMHEKAEYARMHYATKNGHKPNSTMLTICKWNHKITVSLGAQNALSDDCIKTRRNRVWLMLNISIWANENSAGLSMWLMEISMIIAHIYCHVRRAHTRPFHDSQCTKLFWLPWNRLQLLSDIFGGRAFGGRETILPRSGKFSCSRSHSEWFHRMLRIHYQKRCDYSGAVVGIFAHQSVGVCLK